MIEVKVKLKEEEKNTLFFRTELMTGKSGDIQITLSLNVDNKALIFQYDEKYYTINFHDLIPEIIKKISEAIE